MKRHLITVVISVFVIEFAATSATSTSESPEMHGSTAGASSNTSMVEPLQTTNSPPSSQSASSAPFGHSPAESSATTSAVDPLPTTSFQNNSTIQATTSEALKATAAMSTLASQKSTSTSRAIEVVAVFPSQRSSSTPKPSVSSSSSQPTSSTEMTTSSRPGATNPPAVAEEDSIKTTPTIPENGTSGKPINTLMSCLIPIIVLFGWNWKIYN